MNPNENTYTAHLEANFAVMFGDIAKPDEIDTLESAEGVCGLPECGCVDACVMCGEVCDG